MLNATVTGGTTTGEWFSSGGGGFSPDEFTLNATYNSVNMILILLLREAHITSLWLTPE